MYFYTMKIMKLFSQKQANKILNAYNVLDESCFMFGILAN